MDNDKTDPRYTFKEWLKLMEANRQIASGNPVGIANNAPDTFGPHDTWEPEPPRRIQRQRTKGWRMPANTIYVGRGSKWGNPYKVDKLMNLGEVLKMYACHLKFMEDEKLLKPEELRGKNLACWCKEGEPCHADILLSWANKHL